MEEFNILLVAKLYSLPVAYFQFWSAQHQQVEVMFYVIYVRNKQVSRQSSFV
jgi:hypothetical protein